jgi:hypothetical protein
MPFFFFFAAMATVTVTTATITAILAATLAAARAIRTRHRASGPPATKSSPHTTRSTYLQGAKPECLHGTGGRASCRQINMIVNVNIGVLN